ncbi:alpha-amylase [Bacteroidia bacterium]|nr:alpha-amylase [Bacteroidia bacterium]
MRALCFYFQIHQPLRLRNYKFFELGENHNYYDDYQNQYLINRIAEKCYLPMNNLLIELIKKHKKKFKVALSISGVALTQFEWYAPNVLDSFKKLVATGNVELLSETEAHSLASIADTDEFKRQIEAHQAHIERVFGVKTSTFRNTELIYSDEIGKIIGDMGFKTMLTEGARHILGWKSPNFVYAAAENRNLNLLLRNYNLSDDISFRFSDHSWNQFPLTAEKFTDYLTVLEEKENAVNIFMDYETFGEHQPAESGIFDFFKALPENVFAKTDFVFATPADISKNIEPTAPISVPFPISWADEERDLTAWLGNDMQNDAFDSLYSIKDLIEKINDPEILKDWKFLQTSDHFYYMSTKWRASGDVHKYFSHYPSPFDAYINYMNILSDFIFRVKSAVNS